MPSELSHNSDQVCLSLLDRIETDFRRVVKLEARAEAGRLTKDLSDQVKFENDRYVVEWNNGKVFDMAVERIRLAVDMDEVRAALKNMDDTFEALKATAVKRGPGRPTKAEVAARENESDSVSTL